MGYAPKHAKPASLRNTALKSHHRPFGAEVSGRHRAGVLPAPPAPPAPRTPPDESIGAVGTADPEAEIRAGEAGEACEEVAGPRASARDDRAEALMKLIPLQRVPLVGS